MKTLAKGICLSILVACMMLGGLILTSTQVKAIQPNFNGTIFHPEGRVNTHTRLGGASKRNCSIRYRGRYSHDQSQMQ